ncbi:MAG: MFS transporter [Acidimicrobiia bacterium]
MRDPNLRRVVAARLISRIGGEAAFFVGIWGMAAFELHATPAELALLMGSLGVAALAGSAVAGLLVDRFNPRRVLLAGEVLFVPAALAVVLADSMGELTVMAALLGLLSTPVYTAISSFAPYLTDDEGRLAAVNGALEAAGMAAFVIGPAAGALLVRFASLDWVFVLDAATSLVAAWLVRGVRLRSGTGLSDRLREGALREIREGFRFTYRHRRLRYYVLMGTSAWLLFGVFSALEPIFFRDVLGTGPEAMGWVNSVFGLGLVAGAAALPRLPRSLTSARGVATVIALNGVGAVAYAGTDRLGVVVGGAVFWGVVIGLMAPMVRTLIHLNSPEALVGRITGTTQVHSEAAHLLPLTFVPVLAGWWGVQWVMVGAGVGLLLLGTAAWREAAHLDSTRTVPVPEPGPLVVADEPFSPNP